MIYVAKLLEVAGMRTALMALIHGFSGGSMGGEMKLLGAGICLFYGGWLIERRCEKG